MTLIITHILQFNTLGAYGEKDPILFPLKRLQYLLTFYLILLPGSYVTFQCQETEQ